MTDASTQAAVNNIDVEVFDSGSVLIGSACTASDGTYTVSGLAAGTYYVGFAAAGGLCGAGQNYLAQYYNDETSLQSADGVVVTDGSTTSGVDAALELAGQVTGTVTDASSNAPVAGVSVELYDSYGNVFDTQCTAANGTYAFSELPGGLYYVGFAVGGQLSGFCGQPQNYLEQYYSDKSSLQTADSVDVTGGATTSGIDAALQAGGQISGTVTDASSKAPIANVEVDVYDSSGNLVNSVCTSSDGTYAAAGLAGGTYHVGFSGTADNCANQPLNYVTQFYDDRTSLQTADGVAVVAGSTTTGIDAALQTGGQIGGTVTAASTQTPLADIEVDVYDLSGKEIAGSTTSTDSNGDFTVVGLPSGSYRVGFSDPIGTYATQYYSDRATIASADEIAVTDGATTTGIDAAMSTTALPTATLTVSRVGSGSGSVSSNPAGISCGQVCTVVFDAGQRVTLTETPAAGSTFGGWSGAGCSGAATTCELTLNSDEPVAATFSESAGNGGGGNGGSSGSTGSTGGVTTRTVGTAATIQLSGEPISIGTGVSDLVTCSGAAGQSCQVTETLTGIETLQGARPVAIAAARTRSQKSRKTLVLGRVTATIAAGRTQLVTVVLNGTGQRLLKRFGRLPVTLVVALTQNGRATTAMKRQLTIKPKARKKRGRG